MVIADIVAEPEAERPVAEVLDRLEGWLGTVSQQGRTWGEPVLWTERGAARAICGLPACDALDPGFDSGPCAQSRRALGQCATISLTVRGDADHGPLLGAYETAPHLLLEPSERAPLRSADGVIPLYRAPLDPVLRQDLTFWCRDGWRIVMLEISSGALEEQARAQLSEPDGHFLRQGRELAHRVETALGRPVYLMVERRAAVVCPSCGGGLPQMRCVGCRLQVRVVEAV